MKEADHSTTLMNWTRLFTDHLVLHVISSADEDWCLVVVHLHETSQNSGAKKTTARCWLMWKVFPPRWNIMHVLKTLCDFILSLYCCYLFGFNPLE